MAGQRNLVTAIEPDDAPARERRCAPRCPRPTSPPFSRPPSGGIRTARPRPPRAVERPPGRLGRTHAAAGRVHGNAPAAPPRLIRLASQGLLRRLSEERSSCLGCLRSRRGEGAEMPVSQQRRSDWLCLWRAALARNRRRPHRSLSSDDASSGQQQWRASHPRSSAVSQRAIRPCAASSCGSVGITSAMCATLWKSGPQRSRRGGWLRGTGASGRFSAARLVWCQLVSR